VILALGAMLTATGLAGERQISADKFFKGLFATALKPSELLTSVSVPAYANLPGMGGAYLKHRHPASSYAVVGVAAMIGLEDGKCTRVIVVVGGATENPVHVTEAEKALTGQAPSEANIAAAAAKAADIEATMSDVYASSEYRAHLASVMTKRALTLAVQRAKA
jgi:carbon-monoxide dehydrogenase medium subunit